MSKHPKKAAAAVGKGVRGRETGRGLANAPPSLHPLFQYSSLSKASPLSLHPHTAAAGVVTVMAAIRHGVSSDDLPRSSPGTRLWAPCGSWVKGPALHGSAYSRALTGLPPGQSGKLLELSSPVWPVSPPHVTKSLGPKIRWGAQDVVYQPPRKTGDRSRGSCEPKQHPRKEPDQPRALMGLRAKAASSRAHGCTSL